jgi:hypothetical protein
MLWIALTLLVILAGVEAALALMRDMLISDKQALLQSLSTVQAAAHDGWMSSIRPPARCCSASSCRSRSRSSPSRSSR